MHIFHGSGQLPFIVGQWVGDLPEKNKAEDWASRLGKSLLFEKLLDPAKLQQATVIATREKARLDRTLLKLGLVEEASLLQHLCDVLSIRPLSAEMDKANQVLANRLTLPFLASRLAMPINTAGPPVLVAMTDPANQSLIDELAFLLDTPIQPVGATTAAVRALIASLESRDLDSATSDRTLAALSTLTENEGPVIRFVHEKLSDAVAQGASDIHLENTEYGLNLRFRINGVLVAQRMDQTLDPSAIVARLKVMAGVNVAERRLPQDGRMDAMIGGRKIDFRFSSLPTHYGESIVARVLDPKQMRNGLDSLGFAPEVVARIRAILERPSGLFLATGPTGSGKTTTLYAAISYLNHPRRKIVTVEDPVEYNLPGVQQVQVHDEIGLTFARVLRGVLRHDPNVILIGEIRDQETADIAVRAAQVGRLVLSTLHTNSAAGAVTRLVDLGVPEFLVRDVLRGVLGQELRLVPCDNCGGTGCEICGDTGVGQRELRAELLEF